MRSQEATLFTQNLSAPFGTIGLLCSDKGLVSVDVHNENSIKETDKGSNTNAELIMANVVTQLTEYFEGKRQVFDLPLDHNGTDYQQHVWQVMTSIPYGQTRQYGEISSQLNSSSRAVGGACKRNPIPIVQPCHRVLAKSGIGGFSGQWQQGNRVDVKSWLLAHESKIAGLPLWNVNER